MLLLTARGGKNIAHMLLGEDGAMCAGFAGGGEESRGHRREIARGETRRLLQHPHVPYEGPAASWMEASPRRLE